MNTTDIIAVSAENISDTQVLWTEADFRRYLHVSQPTSLKIIHQPSFPLIRVGRNLRMIPSDVMAWLREQSSNGTNVLGGADHE